MKKGEDEVRITAGTERNRGEPAAAAEPGGTAGAAAGWERTEAASAWELEQRGRSAGERQPVVLELGL